MATKDLNFQQQAAALLPRDFTELVNPSSVTNISTVDALPQLTITIEDEGDNEETLTEIMAELGYALIP